MLGWTANDSARGAFGLAVPGQPAQATPEAVGAEVVKAAAGVPRDASSSTRVGGEGARPRRGRASQPLIQALMRTVHADLGHENVKRAAAAGARARGVGRRPEGRSDTQVIAVPASFGPAQVAATGEAFKAAGLKVARVMPEPVDAAS